MKEDAIGKIEHIESKIKETNKGYYSDIIKVQILKSFILDWFKRSVESIKVIENLLTRYPNLNNEISDNASTAFYILSSAYTTIGRYEEAMQAIEKARAIKENVDGSSHASLSKFYISLGIINDRKNNFDEALKNYFRALEILEINHLASNDDAAFCHMSIMSTLNDVGKYNSAIEHGKKSIEIYSYLNLSDHPNVGAVFGKLGEIYTTLGDIEKAKDYTERALEFASSKNFESPAARAALHQRLADIYRKSGDLDKALSYTLKGIELTEQSYGKEHPQSGFMYELSAGVFSERKEYGKALEFYHKALAIRLRIENRKSFGDIVSIYTAIVDVYLEVKNFDSALANLKKAEFYEAQSKISSLLLKALVQQRYGEYYAARRQYSAAIRSYHSALSTLTSTPTFERTEILRSTQKSAYKKEASIVLSQLADVHEVLHQKSGQLSDLKEALLFYEMAIDMLEDVRRQYSADGSKFILAQQNKSLYAKACRTALKLFRITNDVKFQEEALLAADRSKANALLEQIFDQEAKHFAGIPDSLLQKEKELLASLAFHEVQSQKMQGKSAIDDSTVRKLQSEIFILKSNRQQFIEYLEQNYPKYHALKYADFTLTVNDIKKHLGEKKVLIEYLYDDSNIYAFALSSSKLVSATITRASVIQQSVGQFTSSLKKYDVEEYHKAGKFLYSQLLKPFEKILNGKEQIIFVPDGVLYYIPFEALPMHHYKTQTNKFSTIPYVIRYHDVSYSYSAAFSVRMEDNVHSSNVSFAGFAPVFRDSIHNGDFLANRSFAEESGIVDVRSITLDGKTFNELKYSEDELLSIGNTFQSRTLPYKNFLFTSATETNFKLFSRNYDVVHVATHGFVNEKNPKLSAILFSQPKEITEQDDGILYLNEMFALDLKANLVVLSSCESGVGAFVQGEGMMALTRGLFYAGAKNIVYSLWKVSDRQTYLLMDEFYKQMLSGKSYSSSLREAKLRMIASEESAFPSKWSGFVLMGE